MVLKDISNIEELFNNSSTSNTDLKKCLNAFEFYEFVAKLIGDFKYQNAEEVYSVYDKLYVDYENVITVFKAKFKQYKEDTNNKKMDTKLIYNYLKSGIYLFLFRYLFLKYHIFNESQLDDIYNEGWKKFLAKNINLDTKKLKLPKKLESKITKFKFIEFYSNFEILNIQLFDNQAKSNNKFTKDNKANINICLSRLKSFANIDIIKFINLYNGKKKTYSDLSFKILFADNTKTGADMKGKRKTLFDTDVKVRNRLSLVDKKKNKEGKENCDKNSKDEESVEDIDDNKEKKRNVKKKIKINKTDIKKAKKKNKYRKSAVVIENEKEENEE
jgi:hypothetical protein